MMKKIAEWLERFIANRKQAYKASKDERLKDEAYHRIQVREFAGKLCLCLDNTPVLERTLFNDSELQQARFLLYQYLKSVRK